MKERPILMNGEMVRAVLDDRKTQTRRAMRPQPSEEFMPEVGLGNRTLVDRAGEALPGQAEFAAYDENEFYRSPYGQPGDRLWVRETWHTDYFWNGIKPTLIPKNAAINYAATSEDFTGRVLRPSLFMRRWMSRITLEITAVRVERLQEITEADALAEGVRPLVSPGLVTIVCEGGDVFSVTPDYVHGVPPVGGMFHGRIVTHVQAMPEDLLAPARDVFGGVWRTIYGWKSWEANPWVWVVEFRRVTP